MMLLFPKSEQFFGSAYMFPRIGVRPLIVWMPFGQFKTEKLKENELFMAKSFFFGPRHVHLQPNRKPDYWGPILGDYLGPLNRKVKRNLKLKN